MRATVVRAGDLGPDELRRWSTLQARDAGVDTPFLSPHFAVAAEQVGRRVRVAVVEDGAERGFFPFEARRGRVAAPVGGPLCDRQGMLIPPGADWGPLDVLRAGSLRSWRFTAIPPWQVPPRAIRAVPHDSPVIDLAAGYGGYVGARRRQHHAVAARKRRKLEREVGGVAFAATDADGAALSALLRWKSGQYAELGTDDRFAVPWVVELVQRLHAVSAPGFAGALSCLRAGGELVAAHFGMRAGRTWHYWFPAYAPAFGSYSPGLILLMEMARAGGDLGVARIDLGPGDEPYKRHLMNGAVEVALGRADVPSAVSALWGLGRGAKRAALALPGVGPGARTLARAARGRLRGRPAAGGW